MKAAVYDSNHNVVVRISVAFVKLLIAVKTINGTKAFIPSTLIVSTHNSHKFGIANNDDHNGTLRIFVHLFCSAVMFFIS